MSLADISSKEKIPVRTLSRWKQKCLTLGLVGLIREERSDKGTLKLPKELITTIEKQKNERGNDSSKNSQ